MSLLNSFLKKVGVTSYDELNSEEKKTYRSWEESLSGRKLTDEDVSSFLQLEKEETINKLTTLTLNTRDDIFLKMKLELLRKIEVFLQSPVVEKQAVENALRQQLEG